MILDNLLTFSGTSNGATGGITSGAQTDSPTTGTQIASNIIDLGIASGVPSSANGGGARDIGIGDDPAMKLSIRVTTPFVGGTSLQALLEAAPDNGSGAPGSYYTLWTGVAVVEADLDQGVNIANVDMPRVPPGKVVPRYLRLSYITVGTHTGGAVEAQIVLDDFEQITGTNGNLSGYPAGITVAN